MQATHAVYVALQDLNINFRNIIVPEAQRTLQREEPSVVAALVDMDDIISSAGRPLDSILSQLEVQLRNAIMGMEVSKYFYVLKIK